MTPAEQKALRGDGDGELWLYLLFSGAGDVAQAVQGKVELRAAADDGRTDLLVVAIPHELHPQHVRVGCPLRGGKRGRKKMKAVGNMLPSDQPCTRLQVR